MWNVHNNLYQALDSDYGDHVYHEDKWYVRRKHEILRFLPRILTSEWILVRTIFVLVIKCLQLMITIELRWDRGRGVGIVEVIKIAGGNTTC